MKKSDKTKLKINVLNREIISNNLEKIILYLNKKNVIK